MKSVLLWDLRFPRSQPLRVALPDELASAVVRSGAAAAANPAEAGVLSAGGPLSSADLAEVVIPNGNSGQMVRAFLPLSAVMIGAGLGLLAAIGAPVASTPTPSISFSVPTGVVVEGDSGTQSVANTINVNRNGVIGNLVVNLSTGGTAAVGSDYTALPATVTILDGQNSVAFPLLVGGDLTVEPDENVIIYAQLAAYPSATASKTITIQNNDVGAIAPTIVSPPTFTGTAQVGHTLTGQPGAYNNSPTSYANQWQSSTDGGTTWADISGATALNYLLTASENGKILRLREVASNATGSAPANYSVVSAAVTASANLTLTTVKIDGDSRPQAMGGRTFNSSNTSATAMTVAGGGQGAVYGPAGWIQALNNNIFLHDEGYLHAIGGSTSLGMLKRSETTSIEPTGNTAQASTQTASGADNSFSQLSDGRHTVMTHPGKVTIVLDSVNDGSSAAAYYNNPNTGSKSLIHMSDYLDRQAAAGEVTFLCNEIPRGRQAYYLATRLMSGNTATAPQSAAFVDGESYSAPGVVGMFGGLPRYCRKVAANPGQDEYTVSAAGLYTFGGTPPSPNIFVTCSAADASGIVITNSPRDLVFKAWVESSAANFVYNGVDYGLPGALYNRPLVEVIDSWNALLDPATGYVKPGVGDSQQLHQTMLGTYMLGKASKVAFNKRFPGAPSRDERPKRNNWYAAKASNVANPTMTGTLPPTMRVVTPTLVSVDGVITATVNTSTGVIAAVPGAPYGVSAGNYNFVTGEWSISFIGTIPANREIWFEQDLGNGTTIGRNLVYNAMLDMTPAVGTGLGSATTGTVTANSAAIATAAQIPYGWNFEAEALATAVAAGTATCVLGVVTGPGGYPRFDMTADGISTAGGGGGLQSKSSSAQNMNNRVAAGDRLIVGGIIRYGPGPNGKLYGVNGSLLRANVQSSVAMTRLTPWGMANGITILGPRVPDGGTNMFVDSSLLAEAGGDFETYRVSPVVRTDGAVFGTVFVAIQFNIVAGIPFSFSLGTGQLQLRVRNDVA